MLTPAKVLEARDLMRTGEVYQLGRPYETGIPLFGNRHYSLRIPYPMGPLGANEAVAHEALVSGEIGQVGTQFDGLGHIGVGDSFYNGLSRDEFATPEGLTQLGIEQVGPIVTRGVLIDVAGYKGSARLEGGYEITRDDLQQALERQGVTITRGDVAPHSHRLGIALDAGQRAVHEVVAWGQSRKPEVGGGGSSHQP